MLELEQRKSLLIRSIVILLIVLLSFLLFYKFSFSKMIPTFYLKGSDKIELNVNSKYKEPGYVAKIYKKDLKKNVKVYSNLDTSRLGKYYIQYTVFIKYLNMQKTLEREVDVVDSEAPKIEIDGDREATIYLNEEFDIPRASAEDNYDGDISEYINISSNIDNENTGDYEVTYTVEDSSGNSSQEKINVHVIENPNKPKPKPVPVNGAYIDISISNQRLNYYENGELVISSDVVTGINNGTPLGDYSILSKATNVTLKGKDYTSFVKYWMAFIGYSYGLHDASWRSSFGGQIYIYNGSHGCVNMPTYNAAALYERVQIGTPVHIGY